MKKVFVITGASGGLGKCLVKEAGNRGFEIEAVSRAPGLDEQERVAFSQIDISDISKVKNFWQDLKKKYSLDTKIILINNAGKFHLGSIQKTDNEKIEQVFSDNLFTAIHMSKGLVETFKNGTIVNLNSFAGLHPSGDKAIYGAAKAAQRHLHDGIRKELSPGKFRILNLYPYRINTWSEKDEPGTINKTEAAEWIISMSLLNGSFEIADCTILPFGEKS